MAVQGNNCQGSPLLLSVPSRAGQQEAIELPPLLSLSQGTQSSLELPDPEGS